MSKDSFQSNPIISSLLCMVAWKFNFYGNVVQNKEYKNCTGYQKGMFSKSVDVLKLLYGSTLQDGDG